MQKLELGNFVNIQAYKYDGTLYRQWSGVKTILDNDNYVGCLLNKTKVAEKDGQKWAIKNPTLWFFSKKYFFNVTILVREEGLFYYINLASPFFFEDNTIKFIDFDYDIKIYPNKPFSIVDHVDFAKNKERWYNKDIIDVIYKNLALITQMVHSKKDIFDEDYIYSAIKTLINIKEIDKKHFDFLK